MTEIPKELYAAGGAIVAASIAAAVSYLALVIAKEHKISEFRQAWIDALRGEIADYFANVHLMAFIAETKVSSDKQFEHEKLATEILNKALVAEQRIVLRLNPEGVKNKLNKELLLALVTVHELLGAGKHDEAREKLSDLVDKGHAVLKNDWERVKRGETIFRCSRIGFLAILFTSTLALVGVTAQIVFRRGPNDQQMRRSNNSAELPPKFEYRLERIPSLSPEADTPQRSSENSSRR